MSKTKIVRIERPIIGDLWRATDQKHEHEEEFDPLDKPPLFMDFMGNLVTLQKIMGARMVGYFKAVWSIDDGWTFRQYIPKPSSFTLEKFMERDEL